MQFLEGGGGGGGGGHLPQMPHPGSATDIITKSNEVTGLVSNPLSNA